MAAIPKLLADTAPEKAAHAGHDNYWQIPFAQVNTFRRDGAFRDAIGPGLSARSVGQPFGREVS
jgi:hypothetical protein